MLSLRWNIKIAPQDPPGKKSSKSQLKRTASKIQGRKEEPEKVTLHYATTGLQTTFFLGHLPFPYCVFPRFRPCINHLEYDMPQLISTCAVLVLQEPQPVCVDM